MAAKKKRKKRNRFIWEPRMEKRLDKMFCRALPLEEALGCIR